MNCNSITKPEFTDEFIAEFCGTIQNPLCKYASKKIRFCQIFGHIREQKIIVPRKKKVFVPGENQQHKQGGRGCCGEKIEKLIIEAEKEISTVSTVGKLADIAVGNLSHVIEELFKISVSKCPATDSRIEKCLTCDKNTWLTKYEFVRFVLKYGREFIRNIDDLTRLPDLPKKEKRKRTGLFCQLCKCFIPAKARLEDQECELGRW